MKDFKAIVEAFKNVDLNQRKAALATVVKVRGSSYRSPGARMLITDDGRWTGSISGSSSSPSPAGAASCRRRAPSAARRRR